MAPETQEFYSEHQPEGFVVLTALGDLSAGNADERLDQWVAEFGITSPVLADVDYAVWELYNLTGERPYFVVLDREMIVRYVGDDRAGHDQSEDAVLDLLAE